MTRFFEDFTDEELARFEEFDLIPSGDGSVCNDDFYLTLVKYNDKVYAECQEEEPTLTEQDGRLYFLDSIWYMKFDIERFLEDYKDGLDRNDFYASDYELYE